MRRGFEENGCGKEAIMRPATTKEQKYFDHAVDYTERAMNCYVRELAGGAVEKNPHP
jgi:hypothetical protein